MKRRILWLSLLVVFAVVGAGCGKQPNSRSGHQDSQSTKVADKTGNKRAVATKAETPKPSALTTLLSPLMGKNAEDPSTQAHNELTYSQFYYQHNNWYWRLSLRLFSPLAPLHLAPERTAVRRRATPQPLPPPRPLELTKSSAASSSTSTPSRATPDAPQRRLCPRLQPRAPEIATADSTPPSRPRAR